MAKKYSELKVFAFRNRTPEDQGQATQRITVPKSSYELPAIERTLEMGESPFSIDCNLITQNAVYRKLANMGQLATSNSPFFQNRAAHTDHVERIAVRMCNMMGLDENSVFLAKAIANAHDIGHAPFSHTAEEVFNQKLMPHGGKWNHDYFGLNILIEYANHGQTYSGLPITAGTIEGFTKRYKKFSDDAQPNQYFIKNINELSDCVLDLEKKHGSLHLKKWNHIEGQIATTADWVAITVSDIRDLMLMTLNKTAARKALPSELRSEMSKTFNELAEFFPPAKEVWDKMQKIFLDDVKKINDQNIGKPKNEIIKKPIKRQDHIARMEAIVNSFSQELESTMLKDVLDNTMEIYQKNKDKIKNAGDIRELDELMVKPSLSMRSHLRGLEKYMKENVYPKLNSEHTYNMMNEFFDIVKKGFEDPKSEFRIDPTWKEHYKKISTAGKSADEIGSEQVKTIAAYITMNCLEKDVRHYVKKFNPELAAKDKHERLYPTHGHPSTDINLLKTVTSLLEQQGSKTVH